MDNTPDFNQFHIKELRLSKRTINALRRNGVFTVGNLMNLLQNNQLKDFRFIGSKSIDEISIALDELMKRSPKALDTFIMNRAEHCIEKVHYEESNLAKNWAQITESFFRNEKESRIYILLSRFGYKTKTLEKIAADLGITRERVRQVEEFIAGRFLQHVRQSATTELLKNINDILSKYGEELSLNRFRTILIRKDILGQFSEPISTKHFKKIDLLETLVCWLNLLSDTRYSDQPITFPLDIHCLVESGNISIKKRATLLNISLKERRKIRRKVLFTGGITIREASRTLSTDDAITVLLMKDLNLQRVDGEWFSLKNLDSDKENSKIPLRLAGQKMLSVVPVLELNDFYDGLRRYVNRFYSSLAPVNVISYILPLLGFAVDNDRKVSAILPIGDVLSRSEKTFMVAIHKNDGVVSFLEVAEEFFLQKLSLPAVSVTLKRYPIVEKIDEGLYKLRGMEISWQQIETARKRQKRFSQDDEVVHGLDGIIRMKLTVNSYAFLTGVVGANSIKELPGSWSIVCAGESYGDAKIEEFYLWGLAKVFKKLNVQMGERIEMGFNTWNRTLSVEKANHGNT